jgi:hypothetical protein
MGYEQKRNEFAADGDDLAHCTCARCDQPGIFGYRDQDGRLIWYCNQHRLAQFWADARMPSPLADQSNGASTDDNAHQQADRVAAEFTERGLPNTLDVPPWDQPVAVMDDQLTRRARAGELGVWFCNTCKTQIKRNDQSC